MAMITVVYVSSAVLLMSPTDLLDLLRNSRERNHVAQITGMLLYRDGNFMQVLEGEERVVDALQERIRRDPRHRGMICLLRQRLAERAFGDELSLLPLDLVVLELQKRVGVNFLFCQLAQSNPVDRIAFNHAPQLINRRTKVMLLNMFDGNSENMSHLFEQLIGGITTTILDVRNVSGRNISELLGEFSKREIHPISVLPNHVAKCLDHAVSIGCEQ